MNSIWNEKNLTRHLCARQIPWDYRPPTLSARNSRMYYYFFLLSLTIVQCSFICCTLPALILPLSLNTRAPTLFERHWLTRCLFHPSITLWTMSCSSRRRVHQKHKGATGGLHGHARPIIYIDSPRAFEKCRVGHIQYPAQRFYHESLLFDFHLPIFAAVRGNQGRQFFTCNNCLSLHRCRTYSSYRLPSIFDYLFFWPIISWK